MDFTFNIFLVIFALGAFQGLILSLLILLKRPQKTSNYFIGFFLLILSLGCTKMVLQEVVPDFSTVFKFPLIFKFASGPLLYLFVKEVLYKKRDSFRTIAPHFIPSLLIDVIYRSAFPLFGFKNGDHVIQMIHFSTDILALASYLIYALLALRVWLSYKKSFQEKITSSQNKILFWSKKLIQIDILSTLTIIIYIYLTIWNDGYLLGEIKTYYIPYVAVTLYVYFLSYMCYCMPGIEIITPEAMEKQVRMVKHIDLGENSFEERLKQDKIFTDPDLDVQKLATVLNISSRELSQRINNGLGKNFNDYINGLRVEHFNELFLSEEAEDYTIEGMAYDSGFKSKASFYRAYKKAVGLTPLQYQKEFRKKLEK